jgi:hypothetical protein
MPLTSLCLLDSLNPPKSLFQSLVSWFLPQTDAIVMNIDHNADALKESKQLCFELGSMGTFPLPSFPIPFPHANLKGGRLTRTYIAKCMHFDLGDASTISNLRDYDVVYLAALVGCGQTDKELAVQRVVAEMREGALVVIRTSWGLRGLLYPVSVTFLLRSHNSHFGLPSRSYYLARPESRKLK